MCFFFTQKLGSLYNEAINLFQRKHLTLSLKKKLKRLGKDEELTNFKELLIEFKLTYFR